jgi:hypothetical protein
MINLKSIINSFKKKAIKIEKRLRFVISALVLTLTMLISTFFSFDKAYIFIPVFIVLTYFFTFFSVLEDIEKIEWFSLFFMPILLTLSFYLFYFLFPVRWLTRLPFMVLYAISAYALMLCANIFNVGVEKSLQLYRAAFSVNFFFQSLVGFFLFNVIFSFRLNFFFNGLLIALIIFLLAYHLYWSIRLRLGIEKENVLYAGLTAFLLFELAVVCSFVPLKPMIFSLFIISSYYSLAGLIYNHLDQRLFSQTVREYLFVWFFVLTVTLLSINW